METCRFFILHVSTCTSDSQLFSFLVYPCVTLIKWASVTAKKEPPGVIVRHGEWSATFYGITILWPYLYHTVLPLWCQSLTVMLPLWQHHRVTKFKSIRQYNLANPDHGWSITRSCRVHLTPSWYTYYIHCTCYIVYMFVCFHVLI